MLLENYGYRVIDLGKDVPIDTVVSAALTHKVKLIGLSRFPNAKTGTISS